MKIKKYIKDKSNKYKVYIDDDVYTFYDDVIIKYSLLLKEDITEVELKEVIAENDLLYGYYEAIKYINKKMRSKKEIEEYLSKKGLNKETIKKNIIKLEKNNLLNDDIFIKAYVSDQINLTNNGINKIKKDLLKLGIVEQKIEEYLNTIDNQVFIDKINKYVDKKIASNKNSSSYILKNKIIVNLVNLGYNKEDVLEVLNDKIIDDEDALKNEYNKIKKSLEKKYTGEELEYKIKEKLYRKGFRNYEV